MKVGKFGARGSQPHRNMGSSCSALSKVCSACRCHNVQFNLINSDCNSHPELASSFLQGLLAVSIGCACDSVCARASGCPCRAVPSPQPQPCSLSHGLIPSPGRCRPVKGPIGWSLAAPLCALAWPWGLGSGHRWCRPVKGPPPP